MRCNSIEVVSAHSNWPKPVTWWSYARLLCSSSPSHLWPIFDPTITCHKSTPQSSEDIPKRQFFASKSVLLLKADSLWSFILSMSPKYLLLHCCNTKEYHWPYEKQTRLYMPEDPSEERSNPRGLRSLYSLKSRRSGSSEKENGRQAYNIPTAAELYKVLSSPLESNSSEGPTLSLRPQVLPPGLSRYRCFSFFHQSVKTFVSFLASWIRLHAFSAHYLLQNNSCQNGFDFLSICLVQAQGLPITKEKCKACVIAALVADSAAVNLDRWAYNSTHELRDIVFLKSKLRCLQLQEWICNVRHCSRLILDSRLTFVPAWGCVQHEVAKRHEFCMFLHSGWVQPTSRHSWISQTSIAILNSLMLQGRVILSVKLASQCMETRCCLFYSLWYVLFHLYLFLSF